jgi:hypothetical protein
MSPSGANLSLQVSTELATSSAYYAENVLPAVVYVNFRVTVYPTHLVNFPPHFLICSHETSEGGRAALRNLWVQCKKMEPCLVQFLKWQNIFGSKSERQPALGNSLRPPVNSSATLYPTSKIELFISYSYSSVRDVVQSVTILYY